MGLVALLLLMVAALAVLTSTRASASEHVLFEDDFNADVPPASNDVWGWTDGDGPSGADCSIAVAGGQGGGGPTGYLQLRDGCAVAQEGLVVTGPEGGFVNVCIDFDWGQNTSGTGPTPGGLRRPPHRVEVLSNGGTGRRRLDPAREPRPGEAESAVLDHAEF